MNNDFLLFLKAGLSGKVDADLSRSVDWQTVEEMGIKQNVLPLLFDGYKVYYEQRGLQAPSEVKLKWYAATQQAEKHYTNHLQAIITLSDYLAENDFRMMVLKGYSFSLLYPIPNHRPCGDIDIYQFGDFRESDKLLKDCVGLKFDLEHPHHTIYYWNGVMVENHYDFFDINAGNTNRKLDAILKKMANELPYEKQANIILPHPTLSALFSLGHVAQHFVIRKIELRHLIDWLLLVKKHGNEIDWRTIEIVCKDVGLDDFLKVWQEVAENLFDDKQDNTLSDIGKRILKEILTPEYDFDSPDKNLAGYILRVKRWFGSRWKMKLVYKKDGLMSLFYNRLLLFLHLRKMGTIDQ